LKLACWFERRFLFLNFNIFLLFSYHLPFGRCVALRLGNIESPSSENNLRQVCLDLANGCGEEVEKFRDRLFVYSLFKVPLNFSRSYVDIIITSEGLQNLGLCSALRAFEQGGIFIVTLGLDLYGLT
jgi:hypothetical protein